MFNLIPVLCGGRWITRVAIACLALQHLAAHGEPSQAIPDKLVVLTFDDAVKSHRTFVAPLLKELGFGATFFVTHKWMDDRTNFMTWEEVGEIHQMGFEVGNHSWTHSDFSQPKSAARLAGELSLVDRELAQTKAKVPRPASFAYCGNTFGPEAVQRLRDLGYKFARRGEQPEARYATLDIGATYDPKRHHPLLIPTTGDAYPIWTLGHFTNVVARATNGQIVVLQFHGVPDVAHPWVHTPPERFREYMAYLKQNKFRCLAVRDLEPYIDWQNLPDDPLLKVRQPERAPDRLALPVEVEATRRDLKFWLENMLVHHRYTWDEAAKVCGWSAVEVQTKAAEFGINPNAVPEKTAGGKVCVLPYPGGREVRLGFTDGNIDFQRGMKASVFLPWDASSYVVVDVPEAIFFQRGLLYLAHTHIPTIWDERNIHLDNIDWTRSPSEIPGQFDLGRETDVISRGEPDGSLQFERVLPNKVSFGASIQPKVGSVDMELWLRNGSDETLTGLRTQICGHLKGAPKFNQQTTTNKIFRAPSVAVHSDGGNRWIIAIWERCGRAWGQPLVPCIHADPVLPDCAPGETVRVRGRIWFYEGKDVEAELATAQSAFQ
jgi:peptidoglycan/xylan/chitin deacetylase (PgdA/CDA1 family)